MKKLLLPLLLLAAGTATDLRAQTTIFNYGATWKYLDDGSDQGATAWKDSTFNDAAWAAGPGKLGYSDNAVTVVSFGPDATNRYITTYFRKKVKVANLASFDSVRLSAIRDDGFVMYLNGQEIWRENMPAGPIDYRTNAPLVIGGTDETTPVVKSFPKSMFASDSNTIAVEVHQRDSSSSDLAWDLKLEGTNVGPAQTSLLSANAIWKFLDNGTDQGAAWREVTFSDASWAADSAQLGYGDGDENTVISFGPNSAAKYTTTYFRRIVPVANAGQYGSYTFSAILDDGAVFYVNGQEVHRANMPAGAITYNTFSAADFENNVVSFSVPDSFFSTGNNLVAVEVHQRNLTSSDLSFQLAITGVARTAGNACSAISGAHISAFTSVLPSAQPDSLRIPGTHTFQRIAQTGDAYNNPVFGASMAGAFDFTGYVPIGGSSTNGYLSINHENGSFASGAGVSILDLNYSPSTEIWGVTNRARVNFATAQGTVRNCSGGITPWNTVVTSEESLPTADANLDGYQDIGWNVEIDPVTRAIKDYNNDGTPDKLWKLGRISHENVVVAADSIRVYEGADEGTQGFVYKFVAAIPGRLDTGKLYVLKLDSSSVTTGSTGKWIQVPNTTPTQCSNTGSLAQALGATNFNGVEDCEISPLDGKVYFTSKNTSRVYRFRDGDSTISRFEIFVGNGATYAINHSAGTANEAWSNGNDNLTFDELGNLYVLQDGGRNHIWMVKPCHTQQFPAVQLFAVTPAGCEPTGMTFSPDKQFMFVSFQEPDNNAKVMTDAAGNAVQFNKSTTVVIARREFLGTPATPLAMRFTDFSAKAVSGGAGLEWGFISAQPTARFEVQRANSAGEFVTIAERTETVAAGRETRITHTDAVIGRASYRIKHVGADEKVLYTAVRTIDAGATSGLSIVSTYPNPAGALLNLSVQSPVAEEARVRVFNLTGSLVMEQAATLSTGVSVVMLPTATLPAGSYILQLQTSVGTATARFVK